MIHTFVEKWHFGFVVWFFGKKHTAAGVFLNKKKSSATKDIKESHPCASARLLSVYSQPNLV